MSSYVHERLGLFSAGSKLLCIALSACHAGPAPSPASAPAAPASPPPAQAPSLLSAEARKAAGAITPEYLRERIAKLSSDDLEGRGPSTAGDRAARAYLASELAALGFQPGASGWEQPLELVGLKVERAPVWRFSNGKQKLTLSWSEHFIAGSAIAAKQVALDGAELVFAGYGIEAPEYAWDDFKGRDVRGKLLLLLNDDPDWDPALFAGPTRLYYGRWTYKYESAARHGAAGVIIVHTPKSAGYPFQVVRSSWGGQVFELPNGGESALKVKGWVTEDAARSLVQLSGHDLARLIESARSRDFEPVALGTTGSIGLENELTRVQTANVYGILRGSDPTLANEYVVLSAHHDHLGKGKPDASGDDVYNGALDNGAGNATVLAIARAVQALPKAPRRSLLVLFPAAEEQNLLGSKYFVQHSPVETARMAAVINYDGGNIWGKTRDLSQVGYGKSSLDALLRSLAAEQGRSVKPDEFPEKGSFYRSDQLSFARAGVPAVYLKTGTDFIGRPPGWGREQILAYEAQHYHQPSDELRDDWNFDGMVEDAQLGFYVTLAIANADAAPTWLPGDEFEAARKAALARRKPD